METIIVIEDEGDTKDEALELKTLKFLGLGDQQKQATLSLHPSPVGNRVPAKSCIELINAC